MTRRTLFGRIVAVVAAIAGYRTSRPAVIGMDEIGFLETKRFNLAEVARTYSLPRDIFNHEIDVTTFKDTSRRYCRVHDVLSVNEYRRLANLPDIG